MTARVAAAPVTARTGKGFVRTELPILVVMARAEVTSDDSALPAVCALAFAEPCIAPTVCCDFCLTDVTRWEAFWLTVRASCVALVFADCRPR
ncbi:hypothetical protein [Micromonospora tarensis]|uniref:Uncharacterized protein n=1 Tax=Micromonospora tarensis TaxID=2806100 RepID=A0ABS1YBV6_9ACTN|nr:hypothetical protein [Micromonospora tarensis]MBM0274858.1 hypothetical protein [Micromonospora tarensis]